MLFAQLTSREAKTSFYFARNKCWRTSLQKQTQWLLIWAASVGTWLIPEAALALYMSLSHWVRMNAQELKMIAIFTKFSKIIESGYTRRNDGTALLGDQSISEC